MLVRLARERKGDETDRITRKRVDASHIAMVFPSMLLMIGDEARIVSTRTRGGQLLLDSLEMSREAWTASKQVARTRRSPF